MLIEVTAGSLFPLVIPKLSENGIDVSAEQADDPRGGGAAPGLGAALPLGGLEHRHWGAGAGADLHEQQAAGL